jgi:hypothetical protein
MSLLVVPKSARTNRRRAIATRRPEEDFAANTAKSRRTGLVFEVLLGAAACLSLVAVVQEATTAGIPAGSPDAPPPAVFVQTD